MNKPAALAILGSYPPPYGGVGVHTQRLGALLDQRGVRYVIYNGTSDSGDGVRVIPVARGRGKWLLKYMLTGREPAVYLTSDRLITWIMVALMAVFRGKRTMVRLRNSMLPDWMARSRWRRFWAGWALRRMDGVVCVSRLLAECTERLGIPRERIHYSPGFLPPSLDAGERAQVNPAAWSFIESHRPVIAANGKVDWYDGHDLYALDHLVELAVRLKKDFPSIGIVVCFWHHQHADQAYLEDLMRRAAKLGVPDNVFFNTVSGVFVPVLAAADVFVRPTASDGDANSVREALFLGVPTVASDAVERPESALLFRTRDLDDFETKVRIAIAKGCSRGDRPPPLLAADDAERIERYLAVLTGLANGPEGA
jgi:glycosyltransferase involved in cell wall biosynthesis